MHQNVLHTRHLHCTADKQHFMVYTLTQQLILVTHLHEVETDIQQGSFMNAVYTRRGLWLEKYGMRLLTEWTRAQQLWEVGYKSSPILQKHEQHGQPCALLDTEHQPLNRALVPALGPAASAVPSASAIQQLEAVSQLESLHMCQITLQFSCLCRMRTASTLQFSCLCWMRTASTWHLRCM